MRACKPIIYLAILCILSACSKKDDRPDKLLSKSKMAEVLADQLIVEAYAAQRARPLDIHSKVLLDSILYPELYKTHGVDSATYRRSLEYYENDPARLKGLFEKVSAILDKKNAIAIKDSVPAEKTFIHKEPGSLDRVQQLIKQREEDGEGSPE